MIDNSEPAFPCTELDGNGNLYQTFFGMTLRDYLAAKAMQAMIYQVADIDIPIRAYSMADRMLKERNKQ